MASYNQRCLLGSLVNMCPFASTFLYPDSFFAPPHKDSPGRAEKYRLLDSARKEPPSLANLASEIGGGAWVVAVWLGGKGNPAQLIKGAAFLVAHLALQ